MPTDVKPMMRPAATTMATRARPSGSLHLLAASADGAGGSSGGGNTGPTPRPSGGHHSGGGGAAIDRVVGGPVGVGAGAPSAERAWSARRVTGPLGKAWAVQASPSQYRW